MDPFTQRLLERTRQRRELLQEKLANSPQPAQRKRKPLLDDQTENIPPADPNNDERGFGDSPKRHCMRESEQEIKPDTPAVQSVKSRMQGLVSQRQAWSGETDDVDTSCIRPRLQRSPEKLTTENPPVPSSRKSRLAALAQDINNWEDDLSHSPIRKTENKPQPKVWSPHKAQAPAPPVEQTGRKSPVKRQAPPPPAEEPMTVTPEHKSPIKTVNQGNKSPIRSVSPVKMLDTVEAKSSPVRSPNRTASPYKRPQVSSEGPKDNDNGPSKPPRTFEYDSTAPPEVKYEEVKTDNKVISKLTVTLGCSSASASPSSAPVPARSPKKLSPQKSCVTLTQTQTTNKSSLKATGPAGSPLKQDYAQSPRKANTDEPTNQPVSARKNIWETRVQETAKTESTPQAKRSPKKINVPQVCKSPPKQVSHVPAKASAPHSEPVQVSVPLSERMKPFAKKESRKSFEPTSQPVLKRMAAWEQRTVQVEEEVEEQRKGRRSPVKNQFGDKSEGIKAKTSQMEMAEKARRERHAELQQLQRGWKDGMPPEKMTAQQEPPRPPSPVKQSAAPLVPAGTAPAPPPVPAVRSPVKSPAKAPVTNTQPKLTSRREEARNKARSESGASGEAMDTSDTEKQPQFENKLQAMGFDLQSTARLGHVASIDLKGHERPERAIPKDPPAKAPEVTKWEVKKDVKVNWNETKVTEQKNKISVNQKNAGSRSIYNLIKNQQQVTKPVAETKSHPFVKPTGEVVNRAQPAPSAGSMSSTQSDSSSHRTTSDSFDESLMESDGDESTVGAQRDQVFERRPVARQESLTSTTSGASGYSETQTEDYTEDDTAYTEDDTEYTEDTGTEDYHDDEDDRYDSEGSIEDEDDYSDEEEVDDLIDEALDDTTATESDSSAQVQRYPQPVQQKVRSPEKVEFRQPQPPRQRQPSGGHYQPYRAPVTSSTASESATDSDSGKDTAYSVEYYRQTKYKKQPLPQMTIVRHSTHAPSSTEEEELPYIPEQNIKLRIKELQEMIHQEQSVIMQTSNALNQCCGSNSSFAGSMEQVECNRLLLMACKKREAYLAEIERLRSPQGARMQRDARGSLTISDMRLPLKNDFLTKLGSSQDQEVHYFICLIRNGAQVIFTQMVSTHDPNIRGSLEFPNLINFNDIRPDFKIIVEVYGMSVKREAPPVTPKSKKTKVTITPRKLLKRKGTSAGPMASPGGPMAVRTTNFNLIGALPLTLRHSSKMHFSLDKVPFMSPLQGSIHVRLRCVLESQVEEKGFLTMFEDVSGFGAWHRRWCVLKNNMLNYWKYPDDERNKEPMGTIDLKCCISDNIGLIPRDICARPNTFELVTVRRQSRGETDTLVSKCYNTMTSTRHMLSADTKDDRLLWCDKLNQALQNVRTWHSDALRPIRS